MSDGLQNLLNELNFSSAPTVPEAKEYADPVVKGQLCLNMIVKNESKIIERLLGSVLDIIDTYCICDTGSTDDTIERIRNFMKAAGKPGCVYVEPFKNFGYNRTHALNRAAAWGVYALLLDADMKLVVKPEFDKSKLTEPGYSIIQKNPGMEYYNLRFVKTGIGVRCLGPRHEYYDFPYGGGNARLDTLWIQDIGDGGAKADKFERDIRLLKGGLEEEPHNERYHFYIANSYRDVGNPKEAIEWYKKRVALGGWIEEVFYSCYEIGMCYKALGDMPNAIYWWLEAYNRHPKRAESLYELTKYYRESGKQVVGQAICDIARRIPFPKDDVLFIKTPVYDYLLEYEHSILAFYSKAPIDHYKYLNLIGRDYNKHNVLSNYIFYVKRIATLPGVQTIDIGGSVEKVVGGRADDFISSSPCIVAMSEGYFVNVRYVNYRIQKDGSYTFKHSDGKITTLQRRDWLSADLKTVRSDWIDAVADESLRYQGVEDVKIFSHQGALHFLGTVEDKATGRVCVGHGAYDLRANCLNPTALESPHGRGCEKNWVMCHNAAGDLRVVYDWAPLTIGRLDGAKLVDMQTNADVPDFFRDVRGSSNGCRVGNEVWFLCHLVHHSSPRHYYHIIVVLDAQTLKYVRHSVLFKFNGDPIEYALGLVVEPALEGRVLISYSRNDASSALLVIPRDVVNAELFPTST